MVDILLASTWRIDGHRLGVRPITGGGMSDSDRGEVDRFVWRQGRSEVIVNREGDQWLVMCRTTGRLFGPRQVLYEGRHRFAKHAAWDVMARVIRLCQNEDEGVRAGRDAARWMRDAGI